jgi:hypothetical protein
MRPRDLQAIEDGQGRGDEALGVVATLWLARVAVAGQVDAMARKPACASASSW